MDINIIRGRLSHLEDCYEALMKSEIGREYFLNFDARKILIRGLQNEEIDVAIDKDNRCIGFIWYEKYGAFGMHTYLHIIAVKEEYRGKGIGKKLIAQFEENTLWCRIIINTIVKPNKWRICLINMIYFRQSPTPLAGSC